MSLAKQLKNEMLQKLAKPLNPQNTVWEVAVKLSCGNFAPLEIYLPNGFPEKAAPQMRIAVPIERVMIQHPWLDEQMRVVGCAELNAWTKSKDAQIGPILKIVVERFKSEPPVVVKDSSKSDAFNTDDAEEAHERQHFVDVLRAFNDYAPLVNEQMFNRLNHFQRLPAAHQARFPGGAKGFKRKIMGMMPLVNKNAEFFEAVTNDVGYYNDRFRTTEEERGCEHLQNLRRGKRCLLRCTSAPHHMSKVKSTLHQCVRDWADEGKQERAECYMPLIRELLKHLPVTKDNRNKQKIVVPGAGLARLVVELVSRGYEVEGNDFDYFMLLCSSFILNCAQRRHEFSIFPWVDKKCNIHAARDVTKPIKIPDIAAVDLIESNPDSRMSMCAGEFVEIYKHQPGSRDGIATCFFIDTAWNIIEYVEVIHALLKPGGIWTSIGPLMYHWADGSGDDRYDRSVELSFDELRHVILGFGFKFLREERRLCKYAVRSSAMVYSQYNTVLFTVQKPRAAVKKAQTPPTPP